MSAYTNCAATARIKAAKSASLRSMGAKAMRRSRLNSTPSIFTAARFTKNKICLLLPHQQ